MEVFVRGPKGNGRLDLYDPDNNTYYEVKSVGASTTGATISQMEKYDVASLSGAYASLYGPRGDIGRGTEYVSGSFPYGLYDVKYTLTSPGLIVYETKLNWNRAASCVSVLVAAAFTIVTFGASAPAFVVVS